MVGGAVYVAVAEAEPELACGVVTVSDIVPDIVYGVPLAAGVEESSVIVSVSVESAKAGGVDVETVSALEAASWTVMAEAAGVAISSLVVTSITVADVNSASLNVGGALSAIDSASVLESAATSALPARSAIELPEAGREYSTSRPSASSAPNVSPSGSARLVSGRGVASVRNSSVDLASVTEEATVSAAASPSPPTACESTLHSAAAVVPDTASLNMMRSVRSDVSSASKVGVRTSYCAA